MSNWQRPAVVRLPPVCNQDVDVPLPLCPAAIRPAMLFWQIWSLASVHVTVLAASSLAGCAAALRPPEEVEGETAASTG